MLTLENDNKLMELREALAKEEMTTNNVANEVKSVDTKRVNELIGNYHNNNGYNKLNSYTNTNENTIHNNNNNNMYRKENNSNSKSSNKILVKRGQVFWADLGNNNQGSEQNGKRPVIIIQNDVGNTYSPTTIVAVITSQLNKAKLPVHIELPKEIYNEMEKDSVILFEQIRTLDKRRLRDKICQLDELIMHKVDKALGTSVGIKVAEPEEIKIKIETPLEKLPRPIQDEINETLQYIYSYEKVLGRSKTNNLNHLLSERLMLLNHLEIICKDNGLNYKDYYVEYSKERNIAIV